MKYRIYHVIGCFWYLLSCPVMGQGTQKKQLTQADYDKWGTLSINEISYKGNWVSYSMNYTTHADTLFLQHTASGKSTAYPMAKQQSFGGEGFFAFMTGSDLTVRNLQAGTVKVVKGIKSYELAQKGKYLLVLNKDGLLKLSNDKDQAIEEVQGVKEYKMNEEGTGLIYVKVVNQQYQLGHINLNPYRHAVISKSTEAITRLSWQEEGKAVCFMNGNGLGFYHLTDKTIYSLPSAKLLEMAPLAKISSYGEIVVSHDGEKVFFSIESPVIPQDDKSVEVWNANDACLYPAQKQLASRVHPKLVVWFPKTGKYKLINDEVMSGKFLTGMQDYAVLWDPYSYGLITSYPENVDYYIKDVRTGSEKMLLQKQLRIQSQLSFAPKSNTIAYYRDSQWWVYSPEADTTVCLTKGVKTNWDNTSSDAPHQFRIHGIAGWTEDGRSVLIYDEYDIWKAALNGSSCVRLTKGRENKTMYRISKVESQNLKLGNYENIRSLLVNLDNPLVLEIKNLSDWSTGYALYDSKKGIRILDYRAAHLSNIKKSSNGKFVYSSEDFNESPRVNFTTLGDKSVKELFESNKQQKQYLYGRSALIHYSNKDGVPLKGALFYPANYNQDKKYPMIVNIYDQLSKKVHHYENPGMLNSAGHSITNFTSEGYFVLYPDSAYTLGSTGFSAADCVMAAAKAAIDTASIDEKRVGLMGHSFGGYETNFILTQTTMFAAAVSGAGVSDIVGRYFGLSAKLERPDEMWRFEFQQLRMGSSFFKNKQGYLQNSPIMGADRITTPLLLWSGKNDTVIPFQQSVTLYMALRRLGLKSVLLAYPGEDHTLSNPENQADLTKRIMQWFDYFLKDEKEAGWITRGTMNE